MAKTEEQKAADKAARDAKAAAKAAPAAAPVAASDASAPVTPAPVQTVPATVPESVPAPVPAAPEAPVVPAPKVDAERQARWEKFLDDARDQRVDKTIFDAQKAAGEFDAIPATFI